MKKFLLQLIYFLLPILVAAYFIDYFISSNLRTSYTFAEKEYTTWNDVVEGSINSDVVVYGSSRAWVDIDPTMIGDSLHYPTYNLGIDGHNFWLQYLRHKMLLEKTDTPKLIIHSLDAFTFEKRVDLYNSDQFLPYMLFNEDIRKATKNYLGFSDYDYRIPLVRYYGNLNAILEVIKLLFNKQDEKRRRVKGYQGQYQAWSKDFDQAKLTMEKYIVKYDEPSIKLFIQYLKECRLNNIAVIFVYPPEYIEGQNFIYNRNEIIKLYTKYSKEFDVPFYNFSNDTMCNNRSYFYNTMHLNKVGANIFTNKLIDSIKHDSVAMQALQ